MDGNKPEQRPDNTIYGQNYPKNLGLSNHVEFVIQFDFDFLSQSIIVPKNSPLVTAITKS